MSTTDLSAAPPAAAPAAEPEKKKSQPRPYVVLQKVVHATSPAQATSNTWMFVRNEQATSAEQAVRKAAEILVAASEDASYSGTLVAIPARNFVPVPVSVETKTRINIG